MQGKIGAQGSPDDLADIGIDLVSFTTFDEKANHQRCAKQYARRESTLSIASSLNGSLIDGHADDANDSNDANDAQFEAMSKGNATGLAVNYLRAVGNWPVLMAILLSFLFVQFLASFADYWVSVW